MRWLLMLLVAVLAVSDVLGLDLSLGPGLSVKNAVLYAIAFALLARIVVRGGVRVELAGLQAAFAVLIAYAIVTCLFVALVADYPGYRLVPSAIALKSTLADQALFFLAFFYGIATLRDARFVMQGLLLAVAAANLLTIADVVGIANLNVTVGTEGAERGRIFGVFGHANETATLIVALLPAMIACLTSSQGRTRLLWLLASLGSFAVLLMTASRGALVGLVVGSAWAAVVCRRYLPLQRTMRIALVLGVVGTVVFVLVGLQLGNVLTERLLEQTAHSDLGAMSSGRTNIWHTALDRMIATPVTLLTGFGWYMYETLPFRYAPHNHYLWLWFELGLVGVVAFVGILMQAYGTARHAADVSDGAARRQMIGLIFGILVLSIAIVFANLTKPWPYLWAYLGIGLRQALLLIADARARSAASAPADAARRRLQAPRVQLGRRRGSAGVAPADVEVSS